MCDGVLHNEEENARKKMHSKYKALGQSSLFLLLFPLMGSFCVNHYGAMSGAGAGTGFDESRGCSAFTTMLMFGRNSASYCTQRAATAAI